MENGRSAGPAGPAPSEVYWSLEEELLIGSRLLTGSGMPLARGAEADTPPCVVRGREDRHGAAEELALSAGAVPLLPRLRLQRWCPARLGLGCRGRFHGGTGSADGVVCSPVVAS